MRSTVAALIVVSSGAYAHPGHGALQGHFHGWGAEHGLLCVVALVFLLYALKR